MLLTLVATLALSVATPATPAHPAGCGHVYLPEYDETAGLYAQQNAAPWPDSMPLESRADEPNIQSIKQMSFGGQNAEAYWSKDGKHLVYQSFQPGYPDEQIFVMNTDGSNRHLVSTGKGRCTCSYFSPDNKWIYFSSTHTKNEGPQQKLDMSRGYLWMVNPQFSVYRVPAGPAMKGQSAKPNPIITLNGYVAETTIAPNGKYLTFTSDFEGDLEIYRADLDGKNIKKLTDEPGYDGGPFVSWDSKHIVYRRDTIDSTKELNDYKKLLSEHLVRPSRLEIWIMDADGKNKRQVTHLGCASFAPFLHPNGKEILFSSNYGDPKAREFDIFKINVDGTGLRRITNSPDFDGFPMLSRDGKKLVWASNRNGKVRGETNIFTADWKD